MVGILWSRVKPSYHGRCHVKGCGHEVVRGYLGCHVTGNGSVGLYETSVCPPDYEIPDVVDCVVRICETSECPPDSLNLDVEENGRPPQACVRVSGDGCPCCRNVGCCLEIGQVS